MERKEELIMTYKDLMNKLKTAIPEITSGVQFYIRDIIDCPPALLGRKFYDAVANGTITGVEHIGYGDGAEKYRKL